jgi:hypothetical protein
VQNNPPVFITLKQAGVVIGGEESPVSTATVRRRFGHLIEHPTPGTSRIRQDRLINELSPKAE